MHFEHAKKEKKTAGGRMRGLWSSLQIAFSMYSRLPALQCDWTEENMKYVMCFFPWIGIVIGLFCAGWMKLAEFLNFHAPMRTIALMLLPVLISGGIHLDGMLDTADALSAWRTREKRLEILKDSHAGAFAIITCAIYFFLLYGTLDLVQGRLAVIYPAVFVISRSLSAFSVVTFPKASAKGTVAGFSKNAETRTIQITVLSYTAAAAAVILFLEPVYALAMLLGAGLTFFWYYRMAMKQFGGINGDLAGCFLSVCELVMPLCMAAVQIAAGRL